MQNAPGSPNEPLFRWEVEAPSSPRVDAWLERVGLPRLKKAVADYVSASRHMTSQVLPRVLPSVVRVKEAGTAQAVVVWQKAQPLLVSHSRRFLPFLPAAKTVPALPPPPDPVQIVLDDFDTLPPHQQEMVANNLALLWDYFQEIFGGISGFKTAPTLDQDAYMEKLRVTAERMTPARGTEVAFHYVSVELMRQYILFLHLGRADVAAVSLAARTVALIDRGHQMNRKPTVRQEPARQPQAQPHRGPRNRHVWL